MSYTIRDFRVNSLPGVPIPNSRYYVPNGNGTDLNEYLTDLTGAYRLVGSAGSPSTDEKVKVSSNDTTPGFLNGKLVVGAGISFLENNNGGNETLTISHVDTSSAINLDTSGAQVIDLLTFDTFGHVQTVTTRNLTPADIGVPNAWNLLGNSGTDQTVNFVGTLDTQGIQFRTNNNIAGLIENSEPLAPVFARGTGGKSVFLGSHAGESTNLNGEQHSTFIGTYAGRFAKSTANTFVGFHAGLLHTYGGAFGGRNVAFGNWAFNAGYKAYDNTAIGTFALNNIWEGVSNTALGRDAAKSLTYGNGIHAIGSYALLNNSTGISGITITNGGSGYTTATITFSAPQFGVNGGNCSTTATGTAIISSGSIIGVTMTEPGCGYMNISADEHFTELGLDFYWYATTVTITGDGTGATATPIFTYPTGNVGLGGYSGLYDKYGTYNTYLGSNTYSANWRWYDKYSLFAGFGAAVDLSIPSGTAIEKSAAIGYNARVGQSNSIILGGTGADQPNVGIGTIAPNPLRFLDVRSDIEVNGIRVGRGGSGNGTSTPLTNVVMGTTVGSNLGVLSLNNVFIGNNVGFNATTDKYNVFIGNDIGALGLPNRSNVIAIGNQALNTLGSGGVIAIGAVAMFKGGSGQSTAVGFGSLYNNTSTYLHATDGNTAIGYQTLYNLGQSSGATNGQNTATGAGAGYILQTGGSNSFYGVGAASLGSGLTSSYNNGFGQGSLLYLSNTSSNNAFGFFALSGLTTSTGKNVAVGHRAGEFITTGQGNVILGGHGGAPIATLNNHVIIADGNGNSKLEFDNLGQATLPEYGVGAFTGSATYSLNVDASGNIIEGAVAGGGGGDMILSATQTNSGIKTFLNGSFTLRNVANTFNGIFTNTNTADRTYTLQNADGTLAFLSDIPSPITSLPISSLTAATGSNSIDNEDNFQSWDFTNFSTIGLGLFGETTQATGNGTRLFVASTYGANANSSQTTFAADFINSHTGTSSTNVGARFMATSGTNNYAAQFSRGRVSFGTVAQESGYLELNGSSTGTIGITTAAAAGTYTLTLPTTDGNSGEFLQTDGSGVLSWAAASGGSGETNTASNLGGGLANYSTKVGVDLQFNSFNATDFDLASNLISIDATLKGNWDAASSWVTTNGANAVTAFGWGDWSTGVNKTFVDALNVDADTLDGIDSTGFALSSHTHTLSSGATDVTATAAELNLLDLAGLTVGWALLADSATTASWQAIPAGATTFIGLTDTDPANYSGSAGYLVRVNSTPNGLEFVDGTTLFASTSHTHAISTDITGLGTGIATALAVNTGSAGAPILYNGNAGTPSALVGTNITGTASGLTAGAVTGFTAGAGTLTGPASSGVAVTLGNNETITGVKTMSGLNVIQHSSSGLTVRNPANTFTYTFTGGAIAANRTLNIPVITGTDTLAVLGLAQTFTGVQTFTSPATTTSITTASTSFTAWAGATTLLTIGGTGASASMFAPSTLDTTSSTTGAIRTSGGISAAKALNIGTTATIGSTIELGHASDTTLSRVSAGTIAVEGVTVATSSNSLALTNKSVNGVTLVSGGTATLYLSQDGTYTTPSGSGTNVYGEEHTGLTGTTVTLTNSGTTGTLRIYKNGVRLDSTEFSYSGGTSVTVTDTLDSGDMIICDYKY